MDGSWPQPGYDGANTSYNPDATGVPNGLELRADPYLGGWKIEHVLVTPAEYIVVRDSDIIGVDRTDGERTWQKYVPSWSTSPVASNEIIHYSNGFHGFEPTQDRTEWHRSSAIEFGGTAGDLTHHDGTVYVGLSAGSEHDQGHIYGLDVDSRTVVLDTATRWGVAQKPLVTDSNVVISSRVDMLGGFESLIETYSLDGDHKWTISQPGEAALGRGVEPLLVGNGRVYTHRYTEDMNRLVAYDITTGDIDWRKPIDLDWDVVRSALIRDILYLTDYSQVVALNSHNGDELWRYTREPQDTGAIPSPKIAASLESLCVSGAPAVGLDPDTGDVLWKYDEPLVAHAVVDDELVASRDQDLLVFRDEDASDGSGYTQVFRKCPNCDENLQSYNDPQHCPNCGTDLDTN